MIIRVAKKKGSITLAFRAESGQEGVDLKDVVLAMGGRNRFDVPLINDLKNLGYSGEVTKKNANSIEVRASRKDNASEPKL